MDTLRGTVTLLAGHAPLGVVDDGLFALLVDHDRAEQWVVTPVPRYGENAVVIETHDRAAGMMLPDQQPGNSGRGPAVDRRPQRTAVLPTGRGLDRHTPAR
jgi:hypothetical protein